MTGSETRMASRVATLLRELPEHEPAADLWARIQSAQGRRRQRRRLRQGIWLGSALAAAALLVVALIPRTTQVRDAQSELAVWQARSHTLEQEWLAASRESMDPRYRAELRLIDVHLQSAYDRGANDSELIPLWKLRSEALRDLIRSDNGRVRALTRI